MIAVFLPGVVGDVASLTKVYLISTNVVKSILSKTS